MRPILFFAAIFLIIAAPALAAHYHLKADGTGAFPNIQAAIGAATSGDTIMCADGIYQGPGNYGLNFGGKNLILKSESSHPRDCVLRSNWTDARLMTFNSGETSSAIVQGFTMERGYGVNYGGGIYISDSSPTIFNCIIQGNDALLNGGGIYIYGASASPSILNCIIRDNDARSLGAGHGGGIYIRGCHGVIKNTDVIDNLSDYGGGIYNESIDTVVLNSIICSNSAAYNDPQVGGPRDTTGFDYCLIEGYDGLPHNFDGYPLFTAGPGGDCYLSTVGNGSICINAGSDLASNICFTTADGSQCMDRWTTRIDQHDDAGQVDVGYHYPHYGANIEVPSYKATIQAGIDAAWEGDVVLLADGTYQGNGNRDLDLRGKRITVKSQSGNAGACIIDCQGSSGSPHRGFYINRGESSQTIVEKIKIINGWSANHGGGIYILNSAPTIRDCILSANYCTDSGAGMMIQFGNPTVTGCTFIGNNSNNAGGGVLCHTCAPTISGCLFENNWALWGGGGLYNYQASPTVNTCTFRYNRTDSMGGGAHNAGNTSYAYYTTCLFLENNAVDGGGMHNRQGAIPTILACEFRANEAGRYGGGIYCNGSSPEMDSCVLNSNFSSTDGGGMYCTYSNTLVENSVFIRNHAEYMAGGFYSREHDNATLSNCTFFRNEARMGGGGMYVYYYSTPDIVRCIFWEETATYGVHIGLDTYCTLTVNCCDIQGGEAGIYRTGGSSVSWGSGNIDADPLFCDAEEYDLSLDSDSPCAPGHSGGCGLIGALDVGCTLTDVEDPDLLTVRNRLHPCYPNPSNPTARIAFDIAEGGFVTLRIYDVAGRFVRTLTEGTRASGHHELAWDGKDESGRNAANGTYLCRMTAGTFTESRRIVLLR